MSSTQTLTLTSWSLYRLLTFSNSARSFSCVSTWSLSELSSPPIWAYCGPYTVNFRRMRTPNSTYLGLHLCLPLLLHVVLLIKLSSRFRGLLHIHCVDLCLRGVDLLGQFSYSNILPEIRHGSIALVDLLVDDGNRISGRFDIRSDLADPGFVLGNALLAFLKLAAPFFADIPSSRHNGDGSCRTDDVDTLLTCRSAC